jgi:metal-sulfur cluster biosynthetic enzyme
MPLDKEAVIGELRKVIDPEIRLDIYSLGLIYNLDIADETVNIKMTFTTPGCPYGPALLATIENAIKDIGAKAVNIELTFEPPWQPPEELKWAMGAFSPWSA